MTPQEKKELLVAACKVRMSIVEATHAAKCGHPGGSLSAADMFTYLYFREMNIDTANPKWEQRDRFVLSKGHTAPGLYSALSLLCGVGCSVLYFWNDRRWYSSILQALPAGSLLAEGIACGIILFTHRMLLAQTIFDLAFAAWFAIVLGKKAERKCVFAMTLAASTALLFFIVYGPASV